VSADRRVGVFAKRRVRLLFRDAMIREVGYRSATTICHERSAP
jgi:hypothetical protein